MSSLLKTASWVVCEKSDGRAVLETFSARIAQSINTERYEAVPILAYLQRLNEGVRNESI